MTKLNYESLKRNKRSYEERRKLFTGLADEARRASKLAIFALQRDDAKRAEGLLGQATRLLAEGQRMVAKQKQLIEESVWQGALEENAEATLFASYLQGKLQVTEAVADNPDAILGGLADLAGEIARHAILRATQRDKQAVEKAHQTVLKIVEVLADLDLTGSLRSKFDQTKQHLRKIEDLRYDLSRR